MLQRDYVLEPYAVAVFPHLDINWTGQLEALHPENKIGLIFFPFVHADEEVRRWALRHLIQIVSVGQYGWSPTATSNRRRKAALEMLNRKPDAALIPKDLKMERELYDGAGVRVITEAESVESN